MSSTVCTNTAKAFLLGIGIIYLLSAGGLSYIGIWVFNSYEHYDEIADSTLTLLPASIILAVSGFMCVIGVLACFAVFKSNKVFLAVFFSLILLVLIGEVLAAALGYVYRGKVEQVLEDDLTDAINEYNVTVYKEQIDYMQHELGCCGVHNATDWLASPAWKSLHPNDTMVPDSCCQGNGTCTLTSKDLYKQSCLDKLNYEFRKNLIYIAGAVVLLAVLQLLALMSTCILVCRTREQSAYQVLGEPVGGGLRV